MYCISDNIEARQWLNTTLVNLVEFEIDGSIKMSSIIPFIDGGTEGFGGQARVFIPRLTSCFECSLPSMPVQHGYPSCTIRNVPRIPEHCIMYALKVEWPMLIRFNTADDYELYERISIEDESLPNGIALDKDDVQHMTWLYLRSKKRAEEYGISGVTYSLTMQVVKNIIPAIASTNALIAAACVNECWKFRTMASLSLNNYYMYMGGLSTGTNTETIEYQRNPGCNVCANPIVCSLSDYTDNGEIIVKDFLCRMEQEHSLSQCSLTINNTVIYITSLHAQYEHNLSKPLSAFLPANNSCIAILNDKLGQSLKLLLIP